MQQVYQQQMESQASLLNTNSSSTAQTSTETLDMSSLKISENNLAAQDSNADTNEDGEKESEDFDENNDAEDHECAEECGFGPDDDGKDEFVYILALCLQKCCKFDIFRETMDLGFYHFDDIFHLFQYLLPACGPKKN